MDPRDLLRYQDALWQRFGDFFAGKMNDSDLTRDRGASHGSIANVTMHALNMEDWWLHSIWSGKEWAGPAWDGFKTAKEMRERIAEVAQKNAKFLDGLKDVDLAEKRTMTVGGESFEATLADVLVEVASEATHHRGEVMALMWQDDIESPYISYLDWLDTR